MVTIGTSRVNTHREAYMALITVENDLCLLYTLSED